MEVNQEGNKEEKHLDAQNPRDVGKEIDQGPSKDDIRMFNYFIRNENTKTLRNVGKEIDQGPSTHDDNISTLPPEALSLCCLVDTRTMQRYLSVEYKIEDSLLPISRGVVVIKSLLNIQHVMVYQPDLESLWVFYPHPVLKSVTSKPTSQPSPSQFVSYVASYMRSIPYEPKMLYNFIKSYMSLPSTPTSQPSPAELASRSVPSIPESSDSTPDDAIYPSTTAAPTSRLSERMKEQFANLESLINKLKERLQKESRRRSRWRRSGWRQIRSLKKELAKGWKELIILKKEYQQEQVDKRWSVQEEVANLFEAALKFSYPKFKDEKSTILACLEKYGDYQCENVLSIWPKLRKEGTMHLGPRRVGWKIKKNLELLQPEMIEREPWVLDIGFVSIKLSGKWMAKGIHKMLRDGIDTWAPKLLMKSVLVNFPSCNPAYLTQMDLLRRELIKTTLIRMLQYCKISVEFSMLCELTLPQEQLDMFQTEKGDDGNVLIFRSAGGEREPLIHAKIDEWSGDPEKDLADLWYGLKKKNDWIVWVTPVQQQEYIKMCIKAAQHAKWLPRDWRDSPRASYTGYQTYNTKMKHEDLDSLLTATKHSCDAAAKELGYTSKEVLNCALKQFHREDKLPQSSHLIFSFW